MSALAGALAGRTALVSGASRGIGREIALRLARGGADVALLARNEDALRGVAKEIEGLGRRAHVAAADLKRPDEASSAVDSTLAALGSISILINNAGITRDNLLLRMKKEEWDEVLEVDLTSVFLLTQAALRPMLRARYGRIVTVTSVVGLSGNPGQANYSAAKAGLVGFTKSLAREVASRSITANAVAPGFVETDMTASLAPDARDKLLSRVPLGRPGSTTDVAEAVAFLASDAASYITGAVLRVDGGMTM